MPFSLSGGSFFCLHRKKKPGSLLSGFRDKLRFWLSTYRIWFLLKIIVFPFDLIKNGSSANPLYSIKFFYYPPILKAKRWANDHSHMRWWKNHQKSTRLLLFYSAAFLLSEFRLYHPFVIILSRNHILYVESQNRMVNFHTANECLELYSDMRDLEQQLGRNFYRCHRGYIQPDIFIKAQAQEK